MGNSDLTKSAANMSEKFSLKWNDFQENILRSFSNFRENEDLYDVTFVCDDLKQLSAHKLILSSGSEYFKSIFKQNKHSHPLLCLSDMTSSELEQVLDFIYFGEVSVFQEQLDRFLNVAMRFKLEGLLTDQKQFTLNETGNMLQGSPVKEENKMNMYQN